MISGRNATFLEMLDHWQSLAAAGLSSMPALALETTARSRRRRDQSEGRKHGKAIAESVLGATSSRRAGLARAHSDVIIALLAVWPGPSADAKIPATLRRILSLVGYRPTPVVCVLEMLGKSAGHDDVRPGREGQGPPHEWPSLPVANMAMPSSDCTPGPSPFSSTKITPARPRAPRCWSALAVCRCGLITGALLSHHRDHP